MNTINFITTLDIDPQQCFPPAVSIETPLSLDEVKIALQMAGLFNPLYDADTNTNSIGYLTRYESVNDTTALLEALNQYEEGSNPTTNKEIGTNK